MTSSLYFLPPTSSPPWLLISSKISSVAFLWGMPQGAAGPERGVETPNLMTSAAPARPGFTASSAARARSAKPIRGDGRFIARSLLRSCAVPIGDGTIKIAVTSVNPVCWRAGTLLRDMRLELHWCEIEALSAAPATRLSDKRLAVDLDALSALLSADARLTGIRLDFV